MLKKSIAIFGLACVASLFGFSQDVRVVDHVPQLDVKVNGFWRGEFRKLAVEWIPHCIRQMEKGGRGEEMLNLVATAEINAGKKPSVKFKGCPWSDAYPYNTVESICLALEIDPGQDEQWRKTNQFLRAKLEEWIPIFLAAQEKDGYIHSFHALKRLPHFSNAANHEFYVMGYFIEMGVAHIRMTRGKDRRLFDAAIRCADLLDATFGPAPKRTWTNGHPGIEYAFLRLADACEKWNGKGSGQKYAKLAQYFVRHQHSTGKGVHHFKPSYNQSERPAEEMSEATGHAVRATYFYTAMAGIASRLNDTKLGLAAERIFANAIDKKEYITGGVGASEYGEAFGPDYDLTLNGYCEACASCGMSFWCTELRTVGGGDNRTEDVRERLLYNLVLGSISNDGRNFLYRNPPNGRERHYPWHGCPCCIGNIPRTLLALKDTMYTFSRDGKTLFVDHFMNCESDLVLNGRTYHAKMVTDYPNGNRFNLTVSPSPDFAVSVRFPNRAESALYQVSPEVPHGYRVLKPITTSSSSADYTWTLQMPLQKVVADPRVSACRGRVAYQRGPTVYTWEGAYGDINVPYRDRLEKGGYSAVWKRDGKQYGSYAFRTWNTEVEFRDLMITSLEGTVLWKGLPDPAQSLCGREAKWTLNEGVLRQSNAKACETELVFGGPAWSDCVIRYQTRCLSGLEGSVFEVRRESENRFIMVNLGGWSNTKHAIDTRGFGGTSGQRIWAERKGQLTRDVWHTVEITCRGDTIAVKLDGQELFAPVTVPESEFER